MVRVHSRPPNKKHHHSVVLFVLLCTKTPQEPASFAAEEDNLGAETRMPQKLVHFAVGEVHESIRAHQKMP